MKSLKDVCEKLKPEYHELIDAYRFHGIVGQDILTYAKFEKVMMADGWILSDVTVAQKWKLLRANGIIKEISPSKAIIDGKALSNAIGYVAYVEEKKIKKNFSAQAETTAEVSE